MYEPLPAQDINELIDSLAVFIIKDAISVQKDDASTPLLYLRLIIRLHELGQTFVVRLVIRL